MNNIDITIGVIVIVSSTVFITLSIVRYYIKKLEPKTLYDNLACLEGKVVRTAINGKYEDYGTIDGFVVGQTDGNCMITFKEHNDIIEILDK